MSARTLGDTLMAWAVSEPSVHLCVLIGSRTRPAESMAAADALSDWDFQIATSRPEMFATGEWLAALGLAPLAYALRTGRLGSAEKASMVTAAGEIDLVIIPVEPLRGLKRLVESGAFLANPQARQALTDLSAVVLGGYRIIKGAEEFAAFYERVTREVPPARLDNAIVCRMAEAFVCDYVFTCRRIERGEWIAAQRWLHHQLVETNFRLLHELRLRSGLPSYPDARRLERLLDPRANDVRVSVHPEEGNLFAAVEQAAATHRRLVGALVGDAWRWPDLSALRLRAE